MILRSSAVCHPAGVQRGADREVGHPDRVRRGGDRAVCHPAGVRKGADRRVGQGGRVGTSERGRGRLPIVVSTSKRASVCHSGPERIDKHLPVCLRRPCRIEERLSVCLCGQFRIDDHLSVWLCRRVWRGKRADVHQSGLFREGKRLVGRWSGPKVHDNRPGFTSKWPFHNGEHLRRCRSRVIRIEKRSTRCCVRRDFRSLKDFESLLPPSQVL